MDISTKNMKYDTNINIIGGLSGIDLILKSFEAYFNQEDTLDKLIFERNEFNIRTEKSRKRIKNAINKGFLNFAGSDHQNLVKNIFTKNIPLQDLEFILLWQFALNNRLFHEITSNVFIKIYYSGRVSISKEDITAYVKEFLAQNKPKDISWSESTINTLSTKYLNIMTKLGFASTGYKKRFNYIHPSSEVWVLFLYFAKLFNPKSDDILSNEFLPFAFIPSVDLHEKLKKLSLKGYFDMNYNGKTLSIKLTHSFEGICDALYN